MANRQYVGARYVPKFADPTEWNNALSYEALTIVTHLGNSFTSKKPVPAGVDIANTEYWVNTGNYSAQLGSIQGQVNTLSQRVTDNNYKNVIVIADSYGVVSADWGAVTPFPVLVKQYLGYNDNNYHYAAQAGAGFANGLFLSNLKSVTVSEPINVTDIYVLGGWNDEIGRSEITGTPITAEMVTNAMTELRTYCWNTYPNANVHLIFTAWRFGAELSAGFLQTKNIYLNANKQQYVCHPDMQYVCHNKAFMGRGEYYDHPNQLGQEAIAKALCNTIKNGCCDIIYDFAVQPGEFTVSNGISWNAQAGTFVFQQFLDNSVIHNELFIPSDNLLITKSDKSAFALKMDGTDFIELASFSGGLSTGVNWSQNIPVMLTLIGTEKTVSVNGFVVVQNGKLYVHTPYYVSEANTAAATALNPHTIIISKGSGLYSANLS